MRHLEKLCHEAAQDDDPRSEKNVVKLNVRAHGRVHVWEGGKMGQGGEVVI